ncbi:MAG: hypothetical protein DCC49_05980 [Acidobacteria bacterium]|nr:MAG: hypothetical protein DCC49_05980 [Acidobacteriota bacterium]
MIARLRDIRILAVATGLVALVACGERAKSGGSGPSASESPSRQSTVGPVSAGLGLAEAARAAAKEDNYKVTYRRVSGREIGSVSFARSGEMTAVRYQTISGPDRQELFTREGGGPDIFCLNSSGGWYCEEGSDPDAPRGGPIFISPRSLERFAGHVATISGDMMRISTQEIAGQSATCYDLVPIPSDGSAGRDPAAADADTFTDLLDMGGSVCFGANKLLKIAVIADPPLTFEGTEISGVTKSDFEPPVAPIKIEPREQRPTVVQGS